MSNIFAQTGLPRPWEKHRVTVCLPHLDTPDLIELSTRLWQLQDEPPFVLVVDTGSRGEATLETLNRLSNDPTIEVARLAIESDVEHRSDRVSIAMDYGFTRCPTEYLLAAHTDMFPKHRGLVRKLRELCDEDTPVVGWEMSPRGPGSEGTVSGSLAKGIPGHVCTIFHMPTMDRIGAGWSIRRAHHLFGLPRGYTDVLGWPDTEVCLGKLLAAHGIEPLLLGRETNDETQETEDWVHARSSTTVYLSRGEFLDRQSTAHRAAWARLEEWEREAAHGSARAEESATSGTHSVGSAVAVTGWPTCHSLRQLRDDASYIACLHPMVHMQGQRASVEFCKICELRTQAPPEQFRSLPNAQSESWRPSTVAVVIPVRDQTFLLESLQSVLGQTRPADKIVVVHEQPVAATPELEVLVRDGHVRYVSALVAGRKSAIEVALQVTESDVICVLEAGDQLEVRYLERGLSRFEGARVGIVYSDVEYFGAETGRRRVPGLVDRDLLGRRNVLHSGCLVLREALHLTRPIESTATDSDTDWRLWRQIFKQGWQARKQASLYRRRVHPSAVSRASSRVDNQRRSYFAEAGLSLETVTLFIPLSGREHLWPVMADFLDRQSWPHDQVRLILFDTSQCPDFSRLVRTWVQNCDYADVRHLRQAVGARGLADQPRLEAAAQVSQAMARIYGRLTREAITDYVWILEDDVFPPDDACSRLLHGFDDKTASVSAAYWSRISHAYVAWQSNEQMIPQRGQDLQTVGGNGFGCVIIRGDVLRDSVFTATLDSPACDNAFYLRLRQIGQAAKVDWSTVAEHRTARPEEVHS